MPRIRNKAKDEFDEFNSSSRRPLTNEEIKAILLDIRRCNGKHLNDKFIDFLGKIDVVRSIQRNGNGSVTSFSVVQDVAGQFSGKEVIPGLGIVYESQIPYEDWCYIRNQFESYLYRREQAEKKERETTLDLYGQYDALHNQEKGHE